MKQEVNALTLCPDKESNLDLLFRREPFCPLNYPDSTKNTNVKKMSLVNICYIAYFSTIRAYVATSIRLILRHM